MKNLFKIMKAVGSMILVGGLVFSSAVFTLLLYTKVTGMYDQSASNDLMPIAYADGLDDEEDELLPVEEEPEVIPEPIEPAESARIEGAPLILQYPELPRGCEVTSLTMLLQFYGADVDKLTLAEEMIRDTSPIIYAKGGGIASWGHPNAGFVGDITLDSPGFGIYHAALFPLLESYVDNPLDLTGRDWADMERQVTQGIPVVLWTTTNYLAPSEWIEWDTDLGLVRTTFREHAVLFVGYDDEHVYINDPLNREAYLAVDKDQFIASWEALGMQALSYEH